MSTVIPLETKPIWPTRKINTPWTNVHMYGTPFDWSLPIFSQTDLNQPSNLVAYRRLTSAVMALGTTRIFVPTTTNFNSEIVTTKQFPTEIRLGGGVTLCRGVEADGVILEKGDAVVQRSGDCPTIIMEDTCGDTVVVLHGHKKVLTGYERENLIDKAMQLFATPSSVTATIVCGIGHWNLTHQFNDRNHGRQNRAFIEHIQTRKWFNESCLHGQLQFGRLNLINIISAQLEAWGVSPQNISSDGSNTFAETEVRRGYKWHSTRRGDTKRNAVFVLKK